MEVATVHAHTSAWIQKVAGMSYHRGTSIAGIVFYLLVWLLIVYYN